VHWNVLIIGSSPFSIAVLLFVSPHFPLTHFRLIETQRLVPPTGRRPELPCGHIPHLHTKCGAGTSPSISYLAWDSPFSSAPHITTSGLANGRLLLTHWHLEFSTITTFWPQHQPQLGMLRSFIQVVCHYRPYIQCALPSTLPVLPVIEVLPVSQVASCVRRSRVIIISRVAVKKKVRKVCGKYVKSM